MHVPDEIRRLQARLMAGEFTLDDLLHSMEQIGQLGPLKSIMKSVPEKPDWDPDEDVRKLRGMIQSMTAEERHDPQVLTPSRRVRIARGSGMTPFDVSEFQMQFPQMTQSMQRIRRESGPSEN